jgi:hypothetical protein
MRMKTWILYRGARLDDFGVIPGFFCEDDPRPVREQIDEAYGFAGGWAPIGPFKLAPVTDTLTYPGDPPLLLMAETRIRDERVLLYRHAIVAIVQPDGSFEIARLD